MPQYLTVAQVAEQLAVDRTFAYRLIHRGEIRAIYVGSALRVSQQEVDDFTERHRVVPKEATA